MAIIKCVECGNDISSLAEACSVCGCPAEYQGFGANNVVCEQTLVNTSEIVKLKNQEQRELAVELFRQKRGQETVEIVERLVGKNKHSNSILCEIIRSKELPIDLILKYFTDQAVSPIDDSKPSKPELPKVTSCPACGKPISVKAESCPNCGHVTGVHVYHRCGSTDWVYIDAVSKVGAMALFGVFAVNTVKNKYQCQKCKYKY